MPRMSVGCWALTRTRPEPRPGPTRDCTDPSVGGADPGVGGPQGFGPPVGFRVGHADANLGFGETARRL